MVAALFERVEPEGLGAGLLGCLELYWAPEFPRAIPLSDLFAGVFERALRAASGFFLSSGRMPAALALRLGNPIKNKDTKIKGIANILKCFIIFLITNDLNI